MLEGMRVESSPKTANEAHELVRKPWTAQSSGSQVRALIGDDLLHMPEDPLGNHDRGQDILQKVMERRGVRTQTRVPFVAIPKDGDGNLRPRSGGDACENEQRAEFTERVFVRLRQRGIHGIRTLRVMLHNMDRDGLGILPSRTFEGALTHMGIRLKQSEYKILLQLFCIGDQGDTEDGVDYVRFLAHGIGNWSSSRLEVVEGAYEFLCENCPGKLLSIDEIEKRFNISALTHELCPSLDVNSSSGEFLKQWSDSVLSADGIITWVDFLDYYLDVSWCFSSDHAFCMYVCKSWRMDIDDWLAGKVFRQYATADGGEDALPCAEFVKMLEELDPSITNEEAHAWYSSIDQDDSGEVDLAEFLSSKVLMVKRLFDKHDTEQTRTVDCEKMVAILQSLNESISRDEAKALYQHADLDGSGGVSFAEFLENNLLKLLTIFTEFGKRRGGDLNEAEMKQLLRKQDPRLSDHDIQQIYRAIDTDGGGSISFIEFCESHVLRAKELFDRYDVEKTRSLSDLTFRKLMMDIDSGLSSSQLDAIYNLLADPNSGKVHLGGFLNPNILKLKLLFDKYDKDGSRFLDSSEFRLMLKDLYKQATDADVEELVQQVCPPGESEGITFQMYIHRFKEIARKYELLHLARKRKARQKAQSKGLVYMES
eukprot:TRINITY_DN19238_c0_g1_i1.p1 TRINITY_DN19238_c0_g1~~TRINITY_DN19238_c0_g1_i1.p1  ORF type:complete len:653 (+),score=145.06 TRINITY_DN19238_c0_g1_i1:224-2182(+)